ncbi:hypothetical protein HanPSC8_Chr02g0058111 [Helianthus annuus]|nr:hypothetical protein HanPSC8_Chr02g0058111 [Helianthus annuus]
MELTSWMKMAKDFKPLDPDGKKQTFGRSRKSSQTSGMKMAFYSCNAFSHTTFTKSIWMVPMVCTL